VMLIILTPHSQIHPSTPPPLCTPSPKPTQQRKRAVKTHSFNNAKFASASYVRFSHWNCT